LVTVVADARSRVQIQVRMTVVYYATQYIKRDLQITSNMKVKWPKMALSTRSFT